jgi:creatinine amidohydrolase/Fe(II)-dependent formamide hydrolase-like protein
MKWDNCSPQQLAQMALEAIVIPPIGAIEQHSPSSRRDRQHTVASQLDKAFGDRLLILSFKKVGVSDHHISFSGTLNLFQEWSLQLRSFVVNGQAQRMSSLK